VILGGGVYEIPCHRQPVFESVEFAMADVKEADEFCPKHICLPITSGTTETDVATIIAAIEKNVQ
jgi:dTDP-4-amino-4,6-dideoxygalactose transaminase